MKLSGEEKKRLTRRYTQNTEAYQLYLRGRYHWTKKTRAGFNVAYQFDWDWRTADREFKRALELDPGSSSTYEPSPSSTLHWYSHYLMTMRRTEESFRTGRRALELDPVDLANNAHQEWYYLWTRDFDRGIDPLKKTIHRVREVPGGATAGNRSSLVDDRHRRVAFPDAPRAVHVPVSLADRLERQQASAIFAPAGETVHRFIRRDPRPVGHAPAERAGERLRDGGIRTHAEDVAPVAHCRSSKNLVIRL